MIHGFANTRDHAETSYGKFLSNVADVLWPDMPTNGVSFFGLHWPGDHPSRVRNLLSFSSRIYAATGSGETLGRYLEAHLSPGNSLVVVAHSLGCRVALACMDYLATSARPESGPNVKAVVLLAAAVPSRDADGPDGQFRVRHAQRYHVHHSNRDVTLMLAFQPGNWLYDKAGVAIGRSGGPAGTRWDERLNTKYGHGDYWPALSTAKAVVSEIYPAATRLLYEISGERDGTPQREWEVPTSLHRF